MKVAIIGRTEALYDTTRLLIRSGHSIACIITAKAAPEYTKNEADFKQLANELNIPFAHSVRLENELPLLKSLDVDIGVSMNYPAVISEEIIASFPFGILNAHGGDLPRYRGNACQAWAILNSEKKIGLCIHKMVGGELDSGDIIARDYLAMNSDSKITNVLNWINTRVPELYVQALNTLKFDPQFVLEKQSKNQDDALRCYPRLPEDGRINWDLTASQILRLINASNRPYSGAFCKFEDKNVTIWDATLVTDNEQFCAIPGQITKIDNDYIEVACGQGKLRLNQIEVSAIVGKPNEWIKSIRKRLT